MHAMLQRKEADALTELGEYTQAEALFAEVRAAQQKLADADAQDLRALADLEVVLVDEALSLETSADPVLGAAPEVRSGALSHAEQIWTAVVSVTGKMVKQDPTNENWRLVLVDAEVHLASVRTRLRRPGDQAGTASKGLATIKDLAKGNGASAMVLDQAANDFLLVEPATLRDPQFAVECAERAAELSHRREAELLLTLSRAYDAAEKREQSRAVASEALALLPGLPPGSAKGNLRKQLESLAQ
jgi:tetratricopeptide (TPR) repeat protein